MECTDPQLVAWVDVPELSKEVSIFLGAVDRPFEPAFSGLVRDGATMVPVRCGRCLACRIQRTKEWKLRMLHELQMHPGQVGLFATLTYDESSLPECGSLDREDLQKFFKRLRKRCGKFRFAACGEYGKITGRPHYHVIFFGLTLPDLMGNSTGRLFRSQIFESCWGLGQVQIGKAENDSISYVAGYTAKKLMHSKGESPEAEYVDVSTGLVLRTVPVSPEFFGTSTNPGLGAEWIKCYGEQVLRDENIALENGKSTPLIPRYYMKKLKEQNHPWFDAFVEQRAGNAPAPSEAAQRRFLDTALKAQFASKSREKL